MYTLDNQYLKTAVELGLVGVVALVVYFLVPFISALIVRRRTGEPELRLLCAALAGAALAAGACSVTFDSLSFPMFSNVYALVIGLIGACWRLAIAGAPAETPPGGDQPAGTYLGKPSRTPGTVLPARG
jgi:O-antigen ligase